MVNQTRKPIDTIQHDIAHQIQKVVQNIDLGD